MRQNGTNTEAPISDETVLMAIAYLDSRTDYREFIPRDEYRPAPRHRRRRVATSQDESPWLLLVPVVVIILALIVLIVR